MTMASKRKPPIPPDTEEPDDADAAPTPRIVTFSVDDSVLAVVTVPLLEGSHLSPLTPVERHVASLAAEGLSNAEIGRRRGTAERTVANQMASILRKLNVGSRYHLAARLALCPLDRGDDRGDL
jgi:DNA-binding CsgD family transcriptional regulator